MRSELTIGGRTIGKGHSPFIMAECGVTCNYDMKITKELIDVVAESGADGIKFIFWFPDEIMSGRDVIWRYNTTEGKKEENMYEMLSKLHFSLEQWKEVKDYADKKGIVLFSTVNSPSGITWTEELQLEAYKLSSWDFNDHPLWRRIAKFKKPMIIDTGPVNSLEVAQVMKVMEEEGNDQSVLVHCYHTDDPKEINMRAIPYMHKTFNCPVGFSATDTHDEMDIAAITLGATFLEKRLTMSRDLPGHHHILSKEPKEFAAYVTMMRSVHAALGTRAMIPSKTDLEHRKEYFRHIVANEDIPKGTVLTESMLEGKRPEEGISPEHMDLFIGRKTKRDLQRNEAIKWEDV